ncbi:hypothetical protein E5F05_16135 [Deinococcus metallilatus]|uniref:Enamine deaminase RidA (YjgF/YER057c/UK114 family) n=1 Tax=Deinococcus metallilatus TaxID=1211322 RepID=A0AAJ5F3Y3_9DEIO|nr:enamine deaminase RidA (YjgF/YER057c/UK114 family) [Deinococcus metallilatus]QBY09342.1 hypothetical protein E5F05_16135 [Deinococcus metallilatus]RXJ09347.1 hypothetical protein ERJ73_14970 [Deinococcus metallilatus]TLK28869.1 hypothetical protein FCS05_06735 [Deinococcus metallilatus]GMA16896.1 hypothetical protein GCM10025871_32270 [Deinococcus metallilatus]
MPRKAFVGSRLAPATGPFSDVVQSGKLVSLSGRVGQDPASATLVQGGAPEQARQIFRNIRLRLKEIGLDLGSSFPREGRSGAPVVGPRRRVQ